jgi:uncharacterized protein
VQSILNNPVRSWQFPIVLLGLILLVLFLSYGPSSLNLWSTFTTIFLGIFIEAVPFLLLGTLASGLVEVFLNSDDIHKFIPASPILGAIIGSLLGLFFPVCECGVVPLTRRLFRKGLPIPTGIAFLLAAPVINPIVIFSTATAFGLGKMVLMRVIFTLLIAIITALVFTVVKDPHDILLPALWSASENTETHTASCSCDLHQSEERSETHPPENVSLFHKLEEVLQVTLDEFFEIGRYLVFGGLIAAAMQTFIPQSILLNVGHGPVISVLVMMGLAILLSICSTVDSFVALGFINAFSTGSVLAFLLYGPMVDIKSTLMFLQVFRPRVVFYLVAIPFVLTLLISVILNYVII